MPRRLIAGLAPGLLCRPDYIIRITANDPTTGNTVSGVVVSGVSIQVDSDESERELASLVEVGPLFAYVPEPV